jgi:hypothetical protein
LPVPNVPPEIQTPSVLELSADARPEIVSVVSLVIQSLDDAPVSVEIEPRVADVTLIDAFPLRACARAH